MLLPHFPYLVSRIHCFFRPVAQLAEQRSPKPQVGGSIPSWPAIFAVNSKEQKIPMADKIKMLMAALILVLAMVGFYVMSDQAQIVRVIALLIGVGIAVFVASLSEPGRNVIGFGRGAVTEIRKVIWPTRKETTHTTIMVLVMVIIIGIILWIFDWFLAWGVRLLTGQGG